MAISLRKITQGNLKDSLKLEVDERQLGTHEIESVPEILETFRLREDCNCRAIYSSDIPGSPVGLVVWSPPTEGSTEATIDRLMIDHNFQNCGYGKAAIQAVIRKIFADPKCEMIRIEYRSWNEAADHLYKKVGFYREDENFHNAGYLITAYRTREAIKILRLRQRLFDAKYEIHKCQCQTCATLIGG